MKALEYIGGIGLVLCLALVLAKFQGGDILDPPNPPGPVESPFPADGFWLLVASDGMDQSKAITASSEIDDWPNLQSKWHDYGQTDLDEPWRTALSWCDAKSNRQPYYVLRHGNKASEGPLTGTIVEQYNTVLAAIKGAN